MTENRKRPAKDMPLARRTILHSACQNRRSLRLVKFLVKTTNNGLRQRDMDGNTALHLALQDTCLGVTSSHEMVDYLVKKCPAALLIENKHGLTPLDLAMRQDELDHDTIALLLTCMANESTSELNLKAGYTSCSIGPELTRLITGHPFESLNISKVHLTKEGVLALFTTLATNCTVKRLTINLFEYLEKIICTALESMLVKNQVLQSLTLRVNMQPVEVSQRLCRAICNGLKMNNSLTELNLYTIPQYQIRLLMPMNFIANSSHVDRTEIDHYLRLNQAGRAKLRDTRLTKKDFLCMILKASNDESVLLDLLRMVPHLWAM